QAPAQRFLLLVREQIPGGHPAVGTRPQVQQLHRLAMQPVRAPVGRDVAAVAPDRAQLHAAHRLPDLAALLDVCAGEDDGAVVGDYLFGNRRRSAEDFGAGPEQHRERDDQQGGKSDPELAGVFHGVLPELRAWWRPRAPGSMTQVKAAYVCRIAPAMASRRERSSSSSSRLSTAMMSSSWKRLSTRLTVSGARRR